MRSRIRPDGPNCVATVKPCACPKDMAICAIASRRLSAPYSTRSSARASIDIATMRQGQSGERATILVGVDFPVIATSAKAGASSLHHVAHCDGYCRVASLLTRDLGRFRRHFHRHGRACPGHQSWHPAATDGRDKSGHDGKGWFHPGRVRRRPMGTRNDRNPPFTPAP